jgi:hypothetical protein
VPAVAPRLPAAVLRLALGVLALAALLACAVGMWLAGQLGPSGSASFSVRPTTPGPVVLGPEVLNRVDAPVTVRARAASGAPVWIGRTTPSDARALLADAGRSQATGVELRSWTLHTGARGDGPAPELASVDVWRELVHGRGSAETAVRQRDAPETLVASAGRDGRLASVEATWQDPDWFGQAVAIAVAGALTAAAAVGALWLLRRRSGHQLAGEHGAVRVGALVAGLTGALALSGCGAGAAVVGLEEPPPQVHTTAAMTGPAAEAVAARVLREATAAAQAQGAQGKALREKALTGPALVAATAASRTPSPTATRDPVSRPPEPTVLAVSRGTGWPRVMLVQTRVDGGRTGLALLTSSGARAPYRLAASAPMLPGESIPALDPRGDGSPLVTDGEGLPVAPGELLKEYAAGLGYPKPASTPHVDVTDAFSSMVRQNAAAQARALGPLGSLSQRHTGLPKATVALRLAGGGAVVFAAMERVDVLTLGPKGKSLTPSKDFTELSGRKALTKRAVLTTLETVVLVVPEVGKAQVVAADEQLLSARGE